MIKLKILGLLIACCFLCSCIIKPRQVVGYDVECNIETKRYELTAEQVKMFENMQCENNGCKEEFVARVVGAVFVVPLSAIVSGSIVVTGNTLHWLEEKGKCL
jgi:hypothetical protein